MEFFKEVIAVGLLFVESIRRLYAEGKISKNKVLELFGSKKISEEEMKYIFEVDFCAKSDVE